MTLQLAPVTDADLPAVADFLHVSLNHKTSAATWRQILLVPWKIDALNHGFLLWDGEQIATALVLNLPLPSFSWRTRASADPQVTKKIVPLARYLLIHYQVVATLAELRIPGRWSRPLFMLSALRSKMHKSTTPETPRIDDLYSGLVCVPW